MNARSGEGEVETTELSLRALISGIQAQDESALAALYDATVSRLYMLALRITGERPAAEEVAADVYFQVWQQADDYNPERGKVSTWLYTICRSRALDQLRRLRQTNLIPLPEDGPDTGVMDADGMADSLLNEVIAMEENTAIAKALRTLNPMERQLLQLAFFKGLTHQEIATCTGMPLGSAKTVLRRAIQALKQKLQDLSP